MAGYSSSSLAFSDLSSGRQKNSGLLKNLPTRISKQHIVEQKMFGSKRGTAGKDFKIGRKFRGFGKDLGKSMKAPKMEGNQKAKGISPSLAEFDKMMNNVVGKNKTSNKGSGKGSMFQRKSFG